MPEEEKGRLTPAMKQYFEYKKKYKTEFLFFQMGDFYELFGEDAVKVSKLLDIALTSRNKDSEDPIPMAGVPLKARDKYIQKLLALGYKVVVCNQTQEPVPGKLVEREVSEVLSPGMVVDAGLIDESRENLVLALNYIDENWSGVFTDVSVGKIEVFSCEIESELKNYISAISPKVILLEKNLFLPQFLQTGKSDDKTVIEIIDIPATLDESLKSHPISSEIRKLAHGEAQAFRILASHILACHFELPRNLTNITRFKMSTFRISDKTLSHLEVFENLKDHSPDKTLHKLLNKTRTPQGSRLLKRVLRTPTNDREELDARLDKIEELKSDSISRSSIQTDLSRTSDLERICGRVVKRKARPADLKALVDTFEIWTKIKTKGDS